MKKYSIEKLVEEVRVALDENRMTNELLSADSGTLTLDEIIHQKIGHALRMVLESAPIALLAGDAIDYPSNQVNYVNGRHTAVLPANYLRFVKARMSDWTVAVTVAVGDDSEAYNKQSSRLPGIRATHTRPIVAEVDRDYGKTLELFGSAKDARLDYLRYIALPAEGEINGEFDAIIEDADISAVSMMGEMHVYFVKAKKTFLAAPEAIDTTEKPALLNNWKTRSSYTVDLAGAPVEGNMWRCKADGEYYQWIDGELKQVDNLDKIDVPEKLVNALIYQTAGLTAATLQKAEFAQTLFAFAQSYMESGEMSQAGADEAKAAPNTEQQ